MEALVVGKRVVEDRNQVEAEVRRGAFDIDEPVDARLTRSLQSR